MPNSRFHDYFAPLRPIQNALASLTDPAAWSGAYQKSIAEPAARDRANPRQAVRNQLSALDQMPMRNRLALLSAAGIPGLSDVAGLGADAINYAQNPQDRTPRNFALTALGALPLVPAMTAIKDGDNSIVDALDFEKRLSEHPESVRNAIDSAMPTYFHGSPADIYGSETGWFKPQIGETGEPVVWGTSDWTSAEGYSRGEIAFTPDASGKFPLTKSYYKDYSGKGGVYGLRSFAKNPFVADAKGESWVKIPQRQIIRDAKKAGHDAVIFKNISDNYQSGGPTSDVIAWLDPQAIGKASDMTGKELYEKLASQLGKEKADQFLANAGVRLKQ